MRKILGAIAIGFTLTISNNAFSHCEIPCGIYNDELRIEQIEEAILTIEKSINAIKELSKNTTDPLTVNQLVRWIDNKDKHATKIQHIVWEYFFTQRVKPINPSDKKKYEKYLKELELLNKISFYTMKVKQSVDLNTVEKLRRALEEFEKLYFGKEIHHH